MATAADNPNAEGAADGMRLGGKLSAYLAAAALLLGNVAGVLSNLEIIRGRLLGWISLNGLSTLLNLSRGFVILCLETAFGIAAYWFYRHLIKPKGWRAKIAFATFCAVCAATIMFLGARMISASVPVELVAHQNRYFVDRIWGQQADRGPAAGGLSWALDPVEPQPWTTAQALTAVLSLRSLTSADTANARKALDYLERTRMSQGWGYFPENRLGVTEVISWVVLANVFSLGPTNINRIWRGGNQQLALAHLQRDLAEIAARQHPDGCFSPVRGTQTIEQARTYSTVMALWALSEAGNNPLVRAQPWWDYDKAIRKTMNCLLQHIDRNASGVVGWWPRPGAPSPVIAYPGLTAQAIFALYRAKQHLDIVSRDPRFSNEIGQFLNAAQQDIGNFPAFASRPLSTNDQLHASYTYITGVPDFHIEASTFLWYPWSLAAALQIMDDNSLDQATRSRARRLAETLISRSGEVTEFVSTDPALFPMAESLFGFSTFVASPSFRDPAP